MCIIKGMNNNNYQYTADMYDNKNPWLTKSHGTILCSPPKDLKNTLQNTLQNKQQPFKKWTTNSKTSWSQRKFSKYKYHADDGKKLAAGGILFFEENTNGKGLWIIEEEENGEPVYTDFGGKYDHNDGDIFATIGREFREETYNTAEIPYNVIKKISEKHHVYIDGYDGKPVYLCIVSHINNFNIEFQSEQIKNERTAIIQSNPNIPDKWYRTLDVKFVYLKDIESKKCELSNRLYAVLKNIYDSPSNYDTEISAFFENFRIPKKTY